MDCRWIVDGLKDLWMDQIWLNDNDRFPASVSGAPTKSSQKSLTKPSHAARPCCHCIKGCDVVDVISVLCLPWWCQIRLAKSEVETWWNLAPTELQVEFWCSNYVMIQISLGCHWSDCDWTVLPSSWNNQLRRSDKSKKIIHCVRNLQGASTLMDATKKYQG